MRTVLVVGVGAGDPEHITVQAIGALRRAEIVFVVEKEEAEDLVRAGDDGCGAFLVWGDPALYDSTIAVLDEILARGAVAFEHEVIPGISSPQALAARHRVPFNRVAGETLGVEADNVFLKREPPPRASASGGAKRGSERGRPEAEA